MTITRLDDKKKRDEGFIDAPADQKDRSNREYRSSVFTAYFSIPEHAARLYEGLSQEYRIDKQTPFKGVGHPVKPILDMKRNVRRKEHISPEDIIFTTLQGVLYLARKNDLAFTARQRILVIGEHQSTINMNMPLRGSIYYGRTMERIIDPKALYRTKQISIPTPEFYVFYNGKDPQPAEQFLKLSDSYLEPTDTPMLELYVKVININLSAGHPILEDCRPLYEYSWFMGKIQEYLEEGTNLDKAIAAAMEDCVQKGIMTDFIREHGSEVRNMLFTEFNLDDAKEVWQEEAREDGRQEGRKEGQETGFICKLVELTCKKLRKNKTPEAISQELEEDLEQIQAICRAAAPYGPEYDYRQVARAMGVL